MDVMTQGGLISVLMASSLFIAIMNGVTVAFVSGGMWIIARRAVIEIKRGLWGRGLAISTAFVMLLSGLIIRFVI